MKVSSPSISDALKKVVVNTKSLLLNDNKINFPDALKKDIFFMQGNGVEITNKLQSLTNGVTTKDKKYPLIWLFRDLKETLIASKNGFDVSCRAKIVILSLTKIDYDSDKRESENFKKVLRPIFNYFIESITKSTDFGMPKLEELKIEKYERFYWGSSQVQQKTNDPVDAIEMDINLVVKNIC
jgi:hypothetical protein